MIQVEDISSMPLDKMEWWVGKDKEVTTQLVEYLKTSTPVVSFLPLCSLLLLENYEEMVSVIRSILQRNPESVHGYVSGLLKSKYYYQRMAVPRILVDMGCKDLLVKCFSDPSGVVIKEAAASLGLYKTIPFSEEELVDIAMALNVHQYDYVQCTVPDILVHLRTKSFLVSEVCLSKSWRKRLAIAKRVSLFSPQDQATIFSLLHKDEEEGVRAALVPGVDSREYWEIFIQDPSERVRALVVRTIQDEFKDLLHKAVEDPSWAVRKELLCIHNESIYESISLPLIASLPSNNDWRVKGEILESILHIAQRNTLLIRRCLTDILWEYLSDKVYEIRTRASKVIQYLVEEAQWAEEWEGRIRKTLSSPNYLIRISLAPICSSFDRRFGTTLVHTLLTDRISNVRLKALEEVEKIDSEQLKEIVVGIPRDTYIDKERKRLGLE